MLFELSLSFHVPKKSSLPFASVKETTKRTRVIANTYFFSILNTPIINDQNPKNVIYFPNKRF